MSSKLKARPMKKPRNVVVLTMLTNCKGGPMKDRRAARGGARNRQRDLLENEGT